MIPTEQPAAEVCRFCGGFGLLRRDVPVGHPDFGEAFPCECYWPKRYKRIFSETIWRHYAEAKIEQFPKRIQTLVIKSLEAGRGCYICGPNGVGKTHLAAGIVHLTWDDWHGSMVLVSQLLDLIRQAFNPETSMVPDDILDGYANTRMLILDDFGAERTTRWAQETMFRLIQHRELERDLQLTVVTSNLSLAELRDYYNTQEDPRAGDRIASRIGGMCEVIRLAGTDRRLK